MGKNANSTAVAAVTDDGAVDSAANNGKVNDKMVKCRWSVSPPEVALLMYGNIFI